MSEINSRNHFYLGREHDLRTGETSSEPLHYKSKDLTTHAVCVGMTGSGKTGLCLSLLEEAALDGVPAIAIDPKGDLGNLLLGFPKLKASDFRPWIDESEALRKEKTPDEFAQQTADLWRSGLASWDQGPERIQQYNDSVERLIFTPGSSAGIPMTVLKSFNAPPKEIAPDSDAFRERTSSAVSGLLALLGIKADPVQDREHIFLSNVLDYAWREGRDLDIADMIREIQKPPFKQVGVMSVDDFFEPKKRDDLANKLNNLLASPTFAGWMQGQPLNVQQLFYSDSGKPRLSIVSIAHLNDSQRMFFVTILLNEILAWMRTQPGTSSLRALLYMDEVFGYFPPMGNPPSKQPMLTLLKQARAFGLGCVLATQNPVDLDYKGLSNCGTWFLGRLQTERDKMRVMDGLEGVSAQAGAKFDKQAMEATLAGLGSRVFLMNNVHDDRPTVFHTRWAMSYLRGPLTRGHIKELMDPVRDQFLPPPETAEEAEQKKAAATQAAKRRPSQATKLEERYLAVNQLLPKSAKLEYRPGLLGSAKLHFVKSTVDVDLWREAHAHRTFDANSHGEVWDGALIYPESMHVLAEAEYEAAYASLPDALTEDLTEKAYQRELRDHLYQTERLTLLECEALDVVSKPDETEQDFRLRITQQAREAGDAAEQKVKQKYATKLRAAEEKIKKKQAYYDEQKSQFWGRIGGFLWMLVDLGLSALGGKATKRRANSSVTAARQAATERGQANRAKVELEEAQNAKEALEADFKQALAEVYAEFDAEHLALEKIEISPRKSDIDVGSVMLVWAPFRIADSGTVVPVY